MKKFALLFLFIWVTQTAFTAHAETDLQALVDETPANETLQLQQGVYIGPVTITKPIKIVGEEGVVVQSDTQGVIVGNVTGIELQKLQFDTKLSPLTITNSKNIELSYLRFSLQEEGVLIEGSERLTLVNLNVSSDSKKHFSTKPNGIDIFKSKAIDVVSLQLTNVQDGIYFERVEDVSIKNTTSTFNRYGIHFMYGKRINVQQNTVTNNVTGLMLMIVEDLTVQKNTILRQLMLNSNGLYLYDVKNAAIENNELLENTVATVWNDVQETTFTNNVFQSNSTVVEAKKSPNVVVENNRFTGNILAARSDKHMFVLQNNIYDDYSGYDFDQNGIGDTPHQTYTSFGQWMVRKPVYQYFIEAPSVVLLNKMDEQSKAADVKILTDYTPVMTEKNDSFTWNIQWLELFIALAAISMIYLIWRKLR